MPLVIDASVALTWCFSDEANPETDKLLGVVARSGATVPLLWHVELINSLGRAERTGRLDVARVDSFLARMDRTPITTDSSYVASHRRSVLAIIWRFGLTAYDATYLELAVRLASPLATLDEVLRTAAKECGVTCLP